METAQAIAITLPTEVVERPYLVVGSTALPIRKAKDVDVICHSKSIKIPTTGDDYLRTGTYNGKVYEFLLTDVTSSLGAILEDYFYGLISPMDALYILKAGHIHIAGRNQETWEKHMHDYTILKLLYEHKLNGSYMGEFEKQCWISTVTADIEVHKSCTDERVKQRTPTLYGKSREQFFDDNVRKFYVHDTIHELVAHEDAPMYSKMQKNPESVHCSRELWDKFSDQQKLYCVLEEAYVIALERWIIPGVKGVTIKRPNLFAFKWALYRICTNLTSGWFRAFAIDNYYQALNAYDETKLTITLERLLNEHQEIGGA